LILTSHGSPAGLAVKAGRRTSDASMPSNLGLHERTAASPCFDCKAGGGAVRGEYQKQNIVLGVHPLGCTCNDMASASIVAPPPLFELYCTLIGPFPKRLATT